MKSVAAVRIGLIFILIIALTVCAYLLVEILVNSSSVVFGEDYGDLEDLTKGGDPLLNLQNPVKLPGFNFGKIIYLLF